MTGFWVVLAVGLVLLVAASLRDRQTRLRSNPSSRPTRPRRLPAPQGTVAIGLDEFRASHERLDARLAGDEFAAWGDPPTIEVRDADVLCCSEPPAGTRELAASLSAARTAMRPLVVVAPPLDDVILAQLASQAGPGNLVVLAAGAEVLKTLSDLAVARPATRADLQSGASPHFHGRLSRLVADPSGCWTEPVEP